MCRLRLVPLQVRRAELPCPHQHPGNSGVLGPEHIGVDVVPHHDRSPGGHAEVGQRGHEEGRRRFADHGDPRLGGGFEPDDERPHVQRRAVGRLVADIAMEGDDRDAAQGQPEGRVEFLVADAGPGPAEEHHSGGAGVDDLDPVEVLAQIPLVDDETAEAGMGIGQVTSRAGDCGEDVAFVDLHPGPSQQRRRSHAASSTTCWSRGERAPCVS